MSPVDIEALAKCLAPMVADQVAVRLGLSSASPASAVAPAIRQRLTLDQFAFIIERSPEVVRRKIRGRRIPKELVEGPPYRLHPKALTLFAVTPEIAIARLEDWNRLHSAPVQTPVESAHTSPA